MSKTNRYQTLGNLGLGFMTILLLFSQASWQHSSFLIELEGDFLQLKFIGGTYADDSQILGGGDFFVRKPRNGTSKSLIEVLLTADTVFLADTEYSESHCLKTIGECSEIPGLESLVRTINRLSLDPAEVAGIQLCTVTLNAEVREVQLERMIFPNFSHSRRRDPWCEVKQVIVCRLDCKGKRP